MLHAKGFEPRASDLLRRRRRHGGDDTRVGRRPQRRVTAQIAPPRLFRMPQKMSSVRY